MVRTADALISYYLGGLKGKTGRNEILNSINVTLSIHKQAQMQLKHLLGQQVSPHCIGRLLKILVKEAGYLILKQGIRYPI